jgi:prepilin-type N-terminal cleavage/methylation domain-containing protein/prepilin-type processing-associated H-X9-DG protein
MKAHSPRKTGSRAAMTLIEVLIVVAIIVVLAAIILPAMRRPQPRASAFCMNNVKQIATGFQMYAQDNNGKFAIRTSIENGGTMEYLEQGEESPHFQKLTGYIYNIRVFVCPADKTRQPSASYDTLADTNLSYFLSADVSTNHPVTSIVLGDRSLQANGHPVRPGTFILRTNMDMCWTTELHRGRGVLGFADGHVESPKTDLNQFLQRQGLASMRLAVP